MPRFQCSSYPGGYLDCVTNTSQSTQWLQVPSCWSCVWEPLHLLQGGRLMRRGPGQTGGDCHDHSLFGSSCRRLLFSYPTCPSRYLVLLVQGIIPGQHRGWMVEVPTKLVVYRTHCYAVRVQTGQAGIDILQKSSGSLQGPLLPLTHTISRFITHAGHLLQTRDKIDHLEEMNRSSRDECHGTVFASGSIRLSAHPRL